MELLAGLRLALDVDLLILLVERSGSEAVELLELQIYTQFGKRLRGGVASRGWYVVFEYVTGGSYKS